jgi:hypothetical protein
VVGEGSVSSGGRGEAMVAAWVEGEGADVRGGGSMLECDVGGLAGITGAGSCGISSSGLRVSMAISFVSAALIRR